MNTNAFLTICIFQSAQCGSGICGTVAVIRFAHSFSLIYGCVFSLAVNVGPSPPRAASSVLSAAQAHSWVRNSKCLEFYICIFFNITKMITPDHRVVDRIYLACTLHTLIPHYQNTGKYHLLISKTFLMHFIVIVVHSFNVT